MRCFPLYGGVGLLVWSLYGGSSGGAAGADGSGVAPAPLGSSRRVVVRLAALFSVDAFAAPGLPLTLALLLVRSAHSRMDVPARSACVMVVVTPGERRAAASFTTVPRSLAAALSPTLSGLLFAAGWISAALVACGALKIAYDLALWRACRGDVLEEHAR